MARRPDPTTALAAIWLGFLVFLTAWAVLENPGLEYVANLVDTNFTRSITSATLSTVITSLFSVILAVSLGLFLGLFAGSSPLWLQRTLEALESIWTVFPPFLIALILVLAVGPSTIALVVAVSAVVWPPISQAILEEVRKFRHSDLNAAAKIAGLRPRDVFWREVWPAVLPQLLSHAARCAATVTTLHFILGFIQPTTLTNSWGAIIASDLTTPQPEAYWFAAPLLMFCLTLLSLARIRQSLRRLSDPILR